MYESLDVIQKKGKNEHDHWGLGLSFCKELLEIKWKDRLEMITEHLKYETKEWI